MTVSTCTTIEYSFDFEPEEIAHLGLDSEIEDYALQKAREYLEPESLDWDEARCRYLMPDETDKSMCLIISF